MKCYITMTIVVFFTESFASEVCINTWFDTIHVCDYGCCGSGPDYGCCNVAALVAGSIFGAIILLSISACCFCFILKKNYRPRRRVSSDISDRQSITTIYSGTNQRLNLALYPTPPPSYSESAYHQQVPTAYSPPPPYTES